MLAVVSLTTLAVVSQSDWLRLLSCISSRSDSTLVLSQCSQSLYATSMTMLAVVSLTTLAVVSLTTLAVVSLTDYDC